MTGRWQLKGAAPREHWPTDRRQLTAMTRMTDDLLEAAWVVTRTLPATRHPLDLRPVVTATVRDIQAAPPRPGRHPRHGSRHTSYPER
jgi:hypothetical protein